MEGPNDWSEPPEPPPLAAIFAAGLQIILVGHHIIYHALQAGIHDVFNAQGFAMHYRTISFASFPNVMSDNGCDFVGHWQILVGHCPMTDCYLQSCKCKTIHMDLSFICK